jgi:hypothetical protein
MADFQKAYSQLILDVWKDPKLPGRITANPTLLAPYGFDLVPPSVQFVQVDPGAPGGVPGFGQQQLIYESGGSVTIYYPPKPSQASARLAEDDTSYCCCCCPCCTCT